MKYLPLFVLYILNFCCIFRPAGNVDAEDTTPALLETSLFWKTSAGTPRGVVVVVHGLNVKPSKMGTPSAEGTLVKLLLDSGYHVYRVTLKGHGGALEDMQNVTQSDWIHDAYFQYCQAQASAADERLPLYLLGFSLGALVYEFLMNEETAIPVQFEKTILFSPALAIRPAAKTVLWLQPFTNDGSIIKSVSPATYRAQTGASIAAYKILFNMEASLCSASFKNCNVDTLIFIDKKDEMITTKILRERIDTYKLTNWKIHEVTNTGAVIRPNYHHLLIDSSCVSDVTWHNITEAMLNFLN